MDINRSQDRQRARDGSLLAIALLVLFAAAASIAIGMPQALEIAATYANTIVTSSPQQMSEDSAPEAAKEESVPLIVDDIRIEGRMYASHETHSR
jgi:hypothetical protein